MIEKRFYVAESNLIDGYCVFDREKKYAFHPRLRKADCLNDVRILNELHNKNEQLRQKVDFYKYFQKDARELEKENEGLKREINMLKTTIGRNEAYIQRMKYGGEWR